MGSTDTSLAQTSFGDTSTPPWPVPEFIAWDRPASGVYFILFRHTYARRALESGSQITWLSRHLGHSSLKVTTDIYGHWERAERKAQVARLEGAFGV